MMAAPEILTPSAKMIGLRVLLVSDNPICSAVLNEQLSDWGMAVVEAEDGACARALLEKLDRDGNPPGMVVLNAPSSDDNGLGLARAISTDARYAGLPIVMLSPRTGTTTLDMEKAGVGAWLAEDFNDLQLREALLRVVGPPPTSGERPRAAITFDPSALDNKVIDRLRALDSPKRPDFLRSLIDRYIHSTDAHMAEMRDAVAVGDAERLRVSAHSFKGSSMNLGAHRLAAVCSELEGRGRDRQLNISTEGLLAKAAYELEHAKIALRVVQGGG